MPSSPSERRRFLTTGLEAVGWYGKDLAHRLDLSPITVSSWRTGTGRLPGYCLAYVSLALKLASALEG